MMPADKSTINTNDHSAYLEVARVDPGSVIKNSVFGVDAYRKVLQLKGGDTSKFDREVKATFKKSAKGSWVPDTDKVAIDHIMLDGFGCPGMMGLWDLHSSNALSWAKMQLQSGKVDANFYRLCAFWSTNNETLNNHVHKHYKTGPTCHSHSFTMASVAAMKAHMEAKHGYEEKHATQAKKPKGKA